MAKLVLATLLTLVLARGGESCNEGLRQKIIKAWEGQNSVNPLKNMNAEGGTLTIIAAAKGALGSQVKCSVTKFNSENSTDYDLLIDGTTVKHPSHSIAWSDGEKSLYNVENGSRVDRYCPPPVNGVYGFMLCKGSDPNGFIITIGETGPNNKEGENQMKEFFREYLGPYQSYPNPCPVSN